MISGKIVGIKIKTFKLRVHYVVYRPKDKLKKLKFISNILSNLEAISMLSSLFVEYIFHACSVMDIHH